MLVAKKDLSYYPNQTETEQSKPKKRSRKKKKYNKSSYKLSIMGITIIGLILSLFILYRYVNITKIGVEITELEKQKAELEKEKDDLTAQLESIKSSSKIQEDAEIKLGMDYPTEEQIVYVDVKQPILSDDTESTRELSIIGQFKNIVTSVLRLF